MLRTCLGPRKDGCENILLLGAQAKSASGLLDHGLQARGFGLLSWLKGNCNSCLSLSGFSQKGVLGRPAGNGPLLDGPQGIQRGPSCQRRRVMCSVGGTAWLGCCRRLPKASALEGLRWLSIALHCSWQWAAAATTSRWSIGRPWRCQGPGGEALVPAADEVPASYSGPSAARLVKRPGCLQNVRRPHI